MTKPKTNRKCRYCQCDISHLGRGYQVCLDPICRERFEEDARKRKNAKNAAWCKENRSYNRKWAKAPRTKRTCRYCGKRMKKGRWFFCDDYCKDRYAGERRYDGEWLYG